MISTMPPRLALCRTTRLHIGGLNRGLGVQILSISTARLMVKAFLESTVSVIWMIGISSRITKAVRLVLPDVATTSYTSSCWRAGSSFGRFRSICSKGCFPTGPLSHLCLRMLGFVALSGSAGKIGNLRAQTDFRQQNRRSRKSETGVWSADFGFPALPESLDGSMRQIWER